MLIMYTFFLFWFLNSDQVNPLCRTSAITCSPTLKQPALRKHESPRREREELVCVCGSVHLFISVYGSFSDIWGNNLVLLYVCTALRTSERMIARLSSVSARMCVSDAELEGCVGRSILCWCKLISRIQTSGVLRWKKKQKTVCFCSLL